MTDIPETQQQPRERDRLSTRGRPTDDGGWCTLLVVQEADDSSTIRGLGAPGVKLSQLDMVALAEAILGRAQ